MSKNEQKQTTYFHYLNTGLVQYSDHDCTELGQRIKCGGYSQRDMHG